MSLIFDTQKTGPQTHALIIGVGDYFHVHGGKQPVQGLPQDLDVLKSPQVSAIQFAQWLIHDMVNQAAPLGSVELLLGDIDAALIQAYGATFNADQATIQNLEKACDGWRMRSDQDIGNVSIFYFCGHGIRGDDDFLLAQDFGQADRPFWANAFRFYRTYRAMASCKAFTQFYFVDACRNSPRKWLEEDTTQARGLLGVRQVLDRARNAPILYSTSANQFADGAPHDISRFTRILLDALRKYGAIKRNGVWAVTTESLTNAVREIGNPPNGPVDQPMIMRDGESARDSRVHALPNPKVLARITSEPPQLLAARQLICADGGGVNQTHGPGPVPYEFDLDVGSYTLTAGQWPPVDLEADPPIVTHQF